jgi:hypothetical protein
VKPAVFSLIHNSKRGEAFIMTITRAIAIFCAALLATQTPYTFAQPAQPAPAGQTQAALSDQQLESLVAPIALYPDPILSQVLVASTYPLEVVEAGRWLKQNASLKGQALADAAKKQSWDASVQALVLLPDVLTRMDQNVSWTSDLGNAFLAQQDGVMNAIQRLRQKASAAGALKSTPQQTVATTTDNGGNYITIEPAQPEVVYVPQYNPSAVWGPAPAYYPYPPIYYPPYSGVVAASALSFGVGLAVGAIWGGGWNNWGWNCGWGHHNVTVNNNFISRNNFNRVNVGNGGAWVHNPIHRGGVPYNNRAVSNRFQGAAGAARPIQRPTVGQTQQRLNQGAGGRNFGQGGQGAANRIAPGNTGGRGAMGQGPANVGGGRGGGMPGQGGANRVAPGNLGGRTPQGLPSQGGANRIAPGGGMNRPTPTPSFNRPSPSFNGGGFNRGGGGGFNRGGGGGGFRGGGGGRGGGGRGGGRR